MKLLKILLEGEGDKEEFYRDNNINPDNLSFLGRGDFGTAYTIGDERVLKITSSKNEFNLAKQLEGNNAPVLDSIAKVYKTAVIDGSMYIILEEVDTDSSIEDLYDELQNYLNEQGLSIQYLNHLDTEGLDISDELQNFIDDIEDINRAYRYLGVEASDVKPDNLGYRSDGKLVAFDIDNRRR
jgi:hypothetical protein